jgi:hypothetical protein
MANGTGNGVLRLGERARALASLLGLALAAGGILFGVFAFGVRYATSDVRESTATAAAKNLEQDWRIGAISAQQHNTNLMLVHLAAAMEEPEGSQARRAALQRMREVYASSEAYIR